MYNLCFFNTVKRTLIEKYPTTAAVIKPAIYGSMLSQENSALFICRDSTSAAPRIAGIERRNENSMAVFLLRPENIPPEIVVPDLDKPGRRAKHCISPTLTESTHVIFFSSLSP